MKKFDINKKEKKKYLSMEPKLAEVFSSLNTHYKLSKSEELYRQVDTAVAIARKFNEEVVKPAYKKIDLEVTRDNDYICWDFIKKANEWGFFTMFVPKMFGGKGKNFLAVYPFFEEIASVCVGLANIIGVHYLGYAALSSSWNLRLMNKISREVRKGEETGNPCLVSLAITEPESGTDVEETMLLDRARLETFAQKVPGGYIVNGKKIFISNGHISTWHMVICFSDRSKPSENVVLMAVKNGAKGFSFGKREMKMGQKAAVCSELIFEECFVHDKYICFDTAAVSPKNKKSKKEIVQQLIDNVLSSSRAGDAAFSAGCARGAYETALKYAREKMVNGTLLINHQWAQSMLAEMYKNVNIGRITYMESAYTNAMKGLVKTLFFKPIYYMERFTPSWYYTLFISPILNMRFMTWLFRKINIELYPKEFAQASSGWASLAKFACSDISMINSQLALELMGIDGYRHDIGVEKFLRDAKLLQIYEGTNQLNRLNLFKNLVSRDMAEVEIF